MFQINIQFILKFLGMILILESFFLLSAVGVSYYYQGSDLHPLLISYGIMLIAGLFFYVMGKKANDFQVGRREGMLTVSMTWLILSVFGMLPFLLGGFIPHITDAFFETMSGFTSTGATVVNDIEAFPEGILYWRSLTQWQGGIGIIVFTVALMPIFGGTASQLFDAEISGITHEHFLPRVTQIAKRLFGVYLLITSILILLLWLGPMNFFDAINHAFATVSTGGYSTKNTSIAYWNSAYIEYLTAFFMCIGATNFSLLYFLFKGKAKKIIRDSEFQWFYAIVFIFTVLVTIWLLINSFESNFEIAFRKSFFHISSLITTTGFLTDDFSNWGSFFSIIALLIMVICGCAGSTSGGFKVGRLIILVKNMFNEFKKQTHPNAVIPVRISNQVIPAPIIQRVQTFAFVYTGLIVIGSIIFAFDNVSFDEAIGTAVSAISNIGPALGKYAGGNFHELSELSKWTYSFLMLIGRLEIFTVLTILLPSFWKQ